MCKRNRSASTNGPYWFPLDHWLKQILADPTISALVWYPWSEVCKQQRAQAGEGEHLVDVYDGLIWQRTMNNIGVRSGAPVDTKYEVYSHIDCNVLS